MRSYDCRVATSLSQSHSTFESNFMIKLLDQVDLKLIGDLLQLQTLAGKEFLRIALENVKLMDNKQIDYGSKNISGFGTFGVVVRMNDKFERIKNLFNSGRRKKSVNESILDSFRDISNYSIIALMLEAKLWPDE